MREQARVVVIGGGVTGCAILYHLAKMGWTDCVLLERRELTSGSSWHAAGSLFALTTPSNAALLQKYTIELYPRLEAESGQSCGYHRSGGLILARSADESTALKLAHGRARRNGIETQLLSPAEARSACSRSRPSPSTRSAGRGPPPGSTGCWPIACRRATAGSCCRRC